MTDRAPDLSEAVVVYLRNYPGTNDAEFEARFGATGAREAVRAILDDTSSIPIDGPHPSLVALGDEVERVMHERHPALSPAALEKLSNYVTYLAR